MATITTRGIVLRFANYRDHDRMLSILSPEYGLIDALSRGCRRPKSALMPASELFVYGEFVLYRSNDHFTLTSCQLDDTFYPLRLEPYRLTCATYMAALCNAGAQPGQEARLMFELLLRGLYLLAYNQHTDPLTQTTAYLLQFADVMGYRPRMTRCAHCRTPLPEGGPWTFDIAAGGFCCSNCASRATWPVTMEEYIWMCRVIKNPLSEQLDKAPSRLFEMLRRYAESRLETPIKVSRLLP